MFEKFYIEASRLKHDADGCDIDHGLNAGATKRGLFAELKEQDWIDGFALNFFGAVRLTHAAWPHLKASIRMVVLQ
jgi:NAD(P)-dependent dehydrogenase (short-subunit alcohol dehydrogenase family)